MGLQRIGHDWATITQTNVYIFIFIYIHTHTHSSNLYWSIVDWQCCFSFRYTAKWVSHIYIYIYIYKYWLFLRFFSEYWVEFPVLYRRYLLISCFRYTSVCMSIPTSQFIPPPSLLLPAQVTINLLSTSVALFLFFFDLLQLSSLKLWAFPSHTLSLSHLYLQIERIPIE